MYDELLEIIAQSGNMVFMGGAGVSTESGIPDFRSETGLYAARQKYGFPPETLLSRSFFERSPDVFFAYYWENLVHPHAQPNPAHLALAALERKGKLDAVVTQNIDGLHRRAGSRNVLELHGCVTRNYCVDCGERYALEYVVSQLGAPGDGADGTIPKCGVCGGIVRPDVVLYEEPPDSSVMHSAARAIGGADTLIVGGTSLAVYPAAGLLRFFNGKSLVLINRSPTPVDGVASLVIRDPIGEVLSAVVPYES